MLRASTLHAASPPTEGALMTKGDLGWEFGVGTVDHWLEEGRHAQHWTQQVLVGKN